MGIETCLSTKLSGWKKIGNFSSWENYFNRISLLRKEELKCEMIFGLPTALKNLL